MSETNIEQRLLAIARQRASEFGIGASEVNSKTELLKSGIYDSISFIDLILELESEFGVELDLEKIDPSALTTIDQLKVTISRLQNA